LYQQLVNLFSAVNYLLIQIVAASAV